MTAVLIYIACVLLNIAMIRVSIKQSAMEGDPYTISERQSVSFVALLGPIGLFIFIGVILWMLLSEVI